VQIVLDASQETSLRDHPLVAGSPFLRFYASAPVRSSDGHALGVIAVVDTRPRADVSIGRLTGLEALARLAESELERRLMSQRLRDAAERYRDLAEVSSDWVWETDAQHRLADMVADHPALLGIVRPGMGMRRWELRDAQPVRGVWADHIADLEARREFRGFEYEARTDLGEQRVFRINGRPRFDGRGRFLGYRGTGADVTQRRAEELARALNQRLFETSADLILAMDGKGRYVLVSPSVATILGYSPGELRSRSGVDIVYPADLNRVRDEMRLARRSRAVRHFNCRCVSKDGRIVPMSIVDVWSEADQHHFFIGRDMTEHLAAEERQRQSQRLEALGQLTGGLAHDFNTILSIAMMKVESVLEELPADSPCRQRLESALSAGGRGADLVSRLMTFARRRPLAPTVHAVGTLLDDLAGLVQTALSRLIRLSVDIADDLPRCRIDRTGLETAILNLAVNARDAMPDGGELHISARRRIITPQNVDAQPELLGRDRRARYRHRDAT
jgi:PAS domain S-box-containing protein